MYMVHLFEDSNLCAIHAKRVTIMVKCAAATPRMCCVCTACALRVRCVCAVCALCTYCICAACAQRLLCVCAVCAHTYYAPTMHLLCAYIQHILCTHRDIQLARRIRGVQSESLR